MAPISFDHNDRDRDRDNRTGFLSTYPEVHAVGWGLGHGLPLGLSLAFAPAVTLAAAATVARGMLYAHTGREIKVFGRAVEIPARYLRQIRREPHYFDGAVVAGALLGWTLTLRAGLELWIQTGAWF